MKRFKNLNLYTADEIMSLWGGDRLDKSYHAMLDPELRIGWNLFIHAPTTKLSDIVEALELEGAYDYAVPQPWAESNNFPVAIWWYDKDNKFLGRPLLLKEMFEMLRNKWVNRG